jgi:FkbM family methyltransferase
MDPNLLRAVKHSFVGKIVRSLAHRAFRFKFNPENPLLYHLPCHIDISLYPQGELAEFLFFDKSFERTECSLVASYLKSGMKVVDVGANVGLYSILADKLVAPKGAVWAFEPSAETYQRLLRNLNLNRCSTVMPFQVALSDTDGESGILRSDKGYGDCYRYLLVDHRSTDHSRGETEKGESVAVSSLDQFARHQDIKAADLIKIDIEGGEYRFFKGARRFLQSNHDVVILFENSPDWARRAGHQPIDVWTFLEQLGFEIYAWDQRRARFSQSQLDTAEMLWACRDPEILPKL